MQSVQFQNLDRIVRNSTEKEQKKQSDGESFLDIMKKLQRICRQTKRKRSRKMSSRHWFSFREICWFRDSRFCR